MSNQFSRAAGQKRNPMLVWTQWIALVFAIPACAFAQTFPEYGVIDFESFPDGTVPAEFTPISNQWQASLGVSFSIVNSTTLFPIIATVGAPLAAFTNGGLPDPNMFDGINGLTDPLIDGDASIASDIQIDFSPPVDRVAFYLLDIRQPGNTAERFPYRVFFADGTRLTPNVPIHYATVALLADKNDAGSPITRIQIQPRVSENDCGPNGPPCTVDFAFDTLLFARRSQQPTVGPFVHVAQESAPGAGDFDNHAVGLILPWRCPTGQQLSAAQVYRYNIDIASGPFPGRVNSYGMFLFEKISDQSQALLLLDRSRLFLAETTDGLTLFTVHGNAPVVRQGRPGTDAGHAEMHVDILGSASVPARTVYDDPDDSYVGLTGGAYTSSWTWPENHIDGQAISGLSGNWTALVQFAESDGNTETPTIQGLSDWYAYSSTGDTVPLSLATDRRVQLKKIDTPFMYCMQGPTAPFPPGCAASDLDTDGDVDLFDWGQFQVSFGGP